MAAARNVPPNSPSLRIAPDYAPPAGPEFNRGRVSGATLKSTVPQAAGFISLPPGMILNKRRPFSHWVKLTWARTWLQRDATAAD